MTVAWCILAFLAGYLLCLLHNYIYGDRDV